MRACVLPLLILSSVSATADGVAGSARQIAETTGAKGGLVVYVGCGDGSLTAARCPATPLRSF